MGSKSQAILHQQWFLHRYTGSNSSIFCSFSACKILVGDWTPLNLVHIKPLQAPMLRLNLSFARQVVFELKAN